MKTRVTPKQEYVADSQKSRGKELKHNTKEIHQITKGKTRRRKEKRTTKSTGKQELKCQLSHQGSPLSIRAQHFIHTNFHFHFPSGVVIKAWILERELESCGLFPFFIALGTSLWSLWGQEQYRFMGLL